MKLSSAIFSLVTLITINAFPTAHAALITFDTSSNGNVSESTITESGYDFDLNKKALITDEACGSPTCANNDSNFLLVNYFSSGESFFSFSRTDGLGFDFYGFDLAEGQVNRQNYWATSIQISAITMLGETVNQNFTLDFINDGASGIADDFQTFTTNSNFSNLAAVVVNGFGGIDRNTYSVDNIKLSTVSVPEPSTIALLSITFLLVSLRKKLI